MKTWQRSNLRKSKNLERSNVSNGRNSLIKSKNLDKATKFGSLVNKGSMKPNLVGFYVLSLLPNLIGGKLKKYCTEIKVIYVMSNYAHIVKKKQTKTKFWF